MQQLILLKLQKTIHSMANVAWRDIRSLKEPVAVYFRT